MLNTIAEAIEDIKAGKTIIVVDDEDRENEGDFLTAARNATPEAINFMAKYGRGLICAPITVARAKELELEPMVGHNTSSHETNFTVSVDLIGYGCTTGISATDRSKTTLALIDPSIKPEELGRPGHIFPLIAKDGGVLRRSGHTEAAVDLAVMAGFEPAGLICEIMKDDGEMARLPDLLEFAKEFDMKIVSVKDLIEYRLETLKATGVYKLNSPDNTLGFDLQMNQTAAAILDPFVKDLVSNLNGTISSDLKLTGTLSKPLINGTLTLNNTGVTVNYLKTPYIVNDKVTVENSVVKIDNMILKDSKGGTGTANGTVDLSKELSNPILNVTVKAQNLLALNTTFRDNRLYYGTAYGTGDFSFTGPIDNMRIDIKATTQAGTVFNIPLNTSSTASDYEFIKYVSSKDTTRAVKRTNQFKGVTLNFDLSADEKTIVKIYTDYGLLTGSGTAQNLQLKINSLGDFDMAGNFLISSGKFEFTAKSVFTKVFQINEGGTIRWTGNPANADINLKTTYEVRANIGDLYQAAGLTSPKGNQYELVQAQLLLTGPLIKPNIDFDFNFPTDPSIKEELATYLNDPTNRNQQALSVIARRSFAKGLAGNNLTSQVSQTAQDAFAELFFTKFNTVLAQNIKGVDLNISSAQEASASWHLFNDRLLISGSLYSTQGSNELFGNSQSLFNSNFSDLTKDFQAQYFIRKDGRLSATYAYRALNNTTGINKINSQIGVQYVNAVGLIYHRDFDTFGEFWRSIWGSGRKTPAKKPDSTAITLPPVTTQRPEDEN